MRRRASHALSEFLRASKRAEFLLKVEKSRHDDPPTQRQRLGSESLRIAAIVLLVASFEEYLKTLFRELTTELENIRSKRSIIITDKLHQANCIGAVEAIIKDSRQDKTKKLLELRRIAAAISREEIIADGFTRTSANPNSGVIAEMLKRWGVGDPFKELAARITTHDASISSPQIIKDTIDSIIGRRNEVAHQGYASGVSITDITRYIDVMKLVASSIDFVCIAEFRRKTTS